VGLRDISRNREKLQEPDPRNRGRGE
jgi:hypothetical protein